MKLRTDFVTNSSSSSFVFTRKLGEDEIIKMLYNIYPNLELFKHDEWDVFGCKNMEEMKEWIKEFSDNVKSMQKLSSEDIVEFFEWYECDILIKLFDIKVAQGTAQCDKYDIVKEFLRHFEAWDITDEQLKTLTAIYIFEFLQNKYCDDDYTEELMVFLRHRSRIAENFVITKKETEKAVSDVLSGIAEYQLYDILKAHPEKFKAFAADYVDKNMGEIMADIVKADNIYYDWGWYYYDLDKILSAFPECVLHCIHMG